MKNINPPTHLEINFENRQIANIKDVVTNSSLKTFQRPLTTRIPKIYIIMDEAEYLYVGVTQQSLRTRFRYGFSANGEAGYHGYKWKDKSVIQLYVWCFTELSSHQLESVEAELVFMIRSKMGIWPIYQNEIHFNNDYSDGRLIAEKIFNWILSNS